MILSLLADKHIESLNMESLPNGDATPEAKGKKTPKHRLQGMTVHSLLAKTFAVGSPFSVDAAKVALRNAGYAPQGFNPTMSRLIKLGICQRHGNDMVFSFIKEMPEGFSLKN